MQDGYTPGQTMFAAPSSHTSSMTRARTASLLSAVGSCQLPKSWILPLEKPIGVLTQSYIDSHRMVNRSARRLFEYGVHHWQHSTGILVIPTFGQILDTVEYETRMNIASVQSGAGASDIVVWP